MFSKPVPTNCGFYANWTYLNEEWQRDQSDENVSGGITGV